MTIDVENCNNCPFKVIDYDSDSVGFDIIEHCNLDTFLDKGYKPIAVYNSYDDDGYDDQDCEYCQNYWYIFHENKTHNLPEPIFEESKCECEKLKQEYLDSLPKVEFKSPDWCPLTELKEITIKTK